MNDKTVDRLERLSEAAAESGDERKDGDRGVLESLRDMMRRRRGAPRDRDRLDNELVEAASA